MFWLWYKVKQFPKCFLKTNEQNNWKNVQLNLSHQHCCSFAVTLKKGIQASSALVALNELQAKLIEIYCGWNGESAEWAMSDRTGTCMPPRCIHAGILGDKKRRELLLVYLAEKQQGLGMVPAFPDISPLFFGKDQGRKWEPGSKNKHPQNPVHHPCATPYNTFVHIFADLTLLINNSHILITMYTENMEDPLHYGKCHGGTADHQHLYSLLLSIFPASGFCSEMPEVTA